MTFVFLHLPICLLHSSQQPADPFLHYFCLISYSSFHKSCIWSVFSLKTAFCTCLITVQFIDFRQALQSVKINVSPNPVLQINLSQPVLSGVELSSLIPHSLFILGNIGSATDTCRTVLGTSSFDSELWVSTFVWFEHYILFRSLFYLDLIKWFCL